MSVQVESPVAVSENIANATWAAVVALARAYEPEKVHKWNGAHDGDTWTPEELTIMANRLEQTAFMIPILRDLAKAGGVTVS